MITEVKHLELNEFSVGSNFLRGGKCCCRKVGNMGCPFEIPFPLGPVHLVHHKGDLYKIIIISFWLGDDNLHRSYKIVGLSAFLSYVKTETEAQKL